MQFRFHFSQLLLLHFLPSARLTPAPPAPQPAPRPGPLTQSFCNPTFLSSIYHCSVIYMKGRNPYLHGPSVNVQILVCWLKIKRCSSGSHRRRSHIAWSPSERTGTVWNTLHTIPALKDTKEYCRSNPLAFPQTRETKENCTKRIDNRADPLYNFSCVSLQNSCVWLLSPTISIPLELELQGEAHMKFTVKGLRRSFLFVSSSINTGLFLTYSGRMPIP